MRMFALTVMVIGVSMMVSACGGGGGGAAPPPDDTTGPTFIVGDPDDNPLNKSVCFFFDDTTAITASFDEPILGSSVVAGTTFIVTDSGAAVVPGTINTSNSTVPAFELSAPLAPDIYTVTLTSGIKDVAGNVLQNPTAWNFTISIDPPCLPSEIYDNDPSSATPCQCV